MDNYKPTPFIIKTSKSFRFLLWSDFIFITSAITYASLGIMDPYRLPPMLFIIFLLSVTLFMLSSITTTIAAPYIFFKTLKKKGPTLHAYNIFSRYILVAILASLLFPLIVYSTIHFMKYSPTNADGNIIIIITTALFSVINISGFIHLASLYHKYI